MMGYVSLKDNKEDIVKYEENIAKILDRAVKLFRKTDLNELAEKWDKILKNYHAKKQEK
ncbi:MAG: hypothetical protein ACFE8L_01165 [Candidatus Hodarchaeota archaeon]